MGAMEGATAVAQVAVAYILRVTVDPITVASIIGIADQIGPSH
jgi:hypothetical protein